MQKIKLQYRIQMQSKKSLYLLPTTTSAFLHFILQIWLKIHQGRLKAGWNHFQFFTKKPQCAGGGIPGSTGPAQAGHSSRQAVKQAQETPAQLPHTAELCNKLIKSPLEHFQWPSWLAELGDSLGYAGTGNYSPFCMATVCGMCSLHQYLQLVMGLGTSSCDNW